MIFLLLIDAAPAMDIPYGPSDSRSARAIWIEIDSQILNALFCVTGFGLIPWRFRDLYFLMRCRIKHDPVALNHLANIHRSWFRIDGNGPRTYPLHFDRNPDAGDVEANAQNVLSRPPLAFSRTRTGKTATPSAMWKIDLVIWLYVWNTLFQCALAGCMWGFNRFNRPTWTTALFIV